MTKLEETRRNRKLRLREVAIAVGVTPQTVWKQEKFGIRTPRAALKYAPAFPGVSWQELMEEPSINEEVRI